MKEPTGFYDVNNTPVNEGDILLNPMINDLWIVEKKDDLYYGYLVPSSGLIKHPDSAKYPMHTEELEVLADTFKKIGNRYDNPELVGGLDGTGTDN